MRCLFLITFLHGQGTAASLVLAVTVREHLWGLVVCHHKSRRFISYQMRMACEFLAQARRVLYYIIALYNLTLYCIILMYLYLQICVMSYQMRMAC